MKQFLSSLGLSSPSQKTADLASAPVAARSTNSSVGNAARINHRCADKSSRNVFDFGRSRPTVAPSLRLRATAANRSLLRWLRAAELAAWQDADASALRGLKYLPR